MAGTERYERSVEEIEETLALAGLSPLKLRKTTQVIYSNLKQQNNLEDRKKLVLMELDDHLASCIEQGKDLSFKSAKNSHIVLCSESKTYEVKEAEMSNSLVLIPGLKLSNEIQKIPEADVRNVHRVDVERIFHTYYEIRETKPRISDLLTILSPSSFKGVEYEKHIEKSSLFDWEKLRENAQMSDGELKIALTQNLIANMDGYYRLIVFEFEARAVTLMLDFMEENSWPVDEIDKEETYDALKELIPRAVFDLIFEKYTVPSPKNEIIEETGGSLLYKYDEEKVCQMLAKVLLAASPTNAYNNFMEAWNVGTPEQIQPKEKYLNGIALIIWNSKKGRKDVVSFPESNLPENINERFAQLFKVKEKWTVDEIAPYISRLTSKGSNVTALLTKYARPSTSNGVKYYSSKHGK